MCKEIYLFCDIDGVLNNEKTEEPINLINLKLLLKLQSKYNVKIIINSKASWFKRAYDYKIKFIKEKGLTIYDEIVRDSIVSNPKGVEVAAYINKHPNIINYIIVDDSDDYYTSFEEFRHRFVKTKTSNGLTENDINKIIKLIESFL